MTGRSRVHWFCSSLMNQCGWVGYINPHIVDIRCVDTIYEGFVLAPKVKSLILMMLKSGSFARMNGKGSGSQVGKENLPTHGLNA